MKTMSIAVFTVLSIASAATTSSCKKQGAEGGDATCETVVPKMVDMRGNEMVHRLPADKQDKWKGKLSETLLAACNEDKWAQEGLACAMAAKDRKEFESTCRAKMGPNYLAKMMERISPLIKEMGKDMAPPAGAAPDLGANSAPTPLPVPPPPAPITPAPAPAH